MNRFVALSLLLGVALCALPTSPLSGVRVDPASIPADVEVDYYTLNIDHFNANGHSKTF